MRQKMINIVKSCLSFLMGMSIGLGIMSYQAQNEKEMLVSHIEILEAQAIENNVVEVKTMAFDPVDQKMSLTSDFDIRTPYECTFDELFSAIPKEKQNSMYPLIKPILKASEKYGLNPLYLTSVAILESGWGTCETGTYNVMGWTNGHGAWRNFSNYYDCFDHVAYKLSTMYIDTVGPKIKDISAWYCPGNTQYSDTILDIMRNLESSIIKEA